MKFSKKNASAVLASLVLAAAVVPAVAQAATFTASLSTTEMLIPQPEVPTCPARGVLSALGTTSVFGSSAATSTDCVTPSDNNTKLKFDNGFMILNGGGGQTIFIKYEGTFQATAYDFQARKVTYTMTSGTFTINGGTGRYVRASGGGTLSGFTIGDFDPSVPGKGQMEASGFISY